MKRGHYSLLPKKLQILYRSKIHISKNYHSFFTLCCSHKHTLPVPSVFMWIKQVILWHCNILLYNLQNNAHKLNLCHLYKLTVNANNSNMFNTLYLQELIFLFLMIYFRCLSYLTCMQMIFSAKKLEILSYAKN